MLQFGTLAVGRPPYPATASLVSVSNTSRTPVKAFTLPRYFAS